MKRDSPEDSLRFSGRDFSQQELAILRAWLPAAGANAPWPRINAGSSEKRAASANQAG